MKVFKGVVFWILSLTWGSIMTFVGLIATLFAVVFLKGKIHRNGYSFIVEVGGNWGGLCFGAFALCGSYSQEDGPCYDIGWYEHTRRHEFGHAIQNTLWGPLMIFVIEIPSIIRYHYMNNRIKKGLEVKPYDSIWFEGQATRWGTAAIDSIE